ncbi:4'-phosphopantetheinyl transferase [Serratia sp. UGAL515B_01]|uniref:4'-phosphopantetheinyl transferase family protein n=1 Tax=Serratia sp. UGAL515B_01 TaxID=2986763 RepID=UPI00295593BF|nr:4'-phosphopantetheinyl transferase superfamily protein [Serratia sp. UGAL515B_01]WON78411.1 4'-phosphopantetheinyl transferase superfamily protein [Serratia sp. UGAL515B_01]
MLLRQYILSHLPLNNGRNVLSHFLTQVEFIPVSAFSGVVAQCKFSAEDYQDDFFALAGLDFPEHLASAVAKRRAEYLAGRFLARQVLASLGHPNFILLRGEDRAPIWPNGIAGAISHNRDTALCAAQFDLGAACVGIDVETEIQPKRAEALWSGIVSDAECLWLRQQNQPFNLLLTLVFSAKESLFKALYPQVRCYFDFLDARIVSLNMQQCTFELELQKTLTPHFHLWRCFRGSFWLESDNVTTFICC